MLRVRSWMEPPPNSPGMSGEKVFWMTTLSRIPAGNMSSGTTRRSGSGEGNEAPLSRVELYRSPRPRT